MKPTASSLYFPLLCQSGLYCCDKHSIQFKEEDFCCIKVSVLGGLTLWWDNTMAVVCCGARAEPLTHCGQKAELRQEEARNKLYSMWHRSPIGITDNPPNDWYTDKDFWSNKLNNWIYQLSPNYEHKWGGFGDGDVFGGQSFCYHKMSTSLMCSDHLNM